MRIGLLGCGNIGHIIAHHRGNLDITAVYDIIPDKAREIAAICGAVPCITFDDLVVSDTDLIVEAASVRAVRQYAGRVLESGRHLVIMSVGALADAAFCREITAIARESERKIYVPSGAILGLDNIKIGRISRVDSLILKTTKSPESLGITTTERRLIFRGKANECIREFPKNINVSAALSLAAGEEADVELWADPAVDRNIHEITFTGEFGEAYIRVVNVPSPDNPATSYLAALSILTLLQTMDEPLIVGT